MTQAARGASSLATNSSMAGGAGGALLLEGLDGLGVDVVDDAGVAVSHQAAYQVGTHPPQSHHAELQRVASIPRSLADLPILARPAPGDAPEAAAASRVRSGAPSPRRHREERSAGRGHRRLDAVGQARPLPTRGPAVAAGDARPRRADRRGSPNGAGGRVKVWAVRHRAPSGPIRNRTGRPGAT